MEKTADPAAGQCLCGAVQFTLETPPVAVHLCHCKMCRRWGGGLPLAAINAIVSLQNGDSLRWWKSSEWSERGFCGQCGASLFVRAEGSPQWTVSVGALNDNDGLQIGGHVFIDDKAKFYDLADDAPRQTGAQHTAEALSRLAAQFGGDFLQDALAKVRNHFGDFFADEVKKLLAQK